MSAEGTEKETNGNEIDYFEKVYEFSQLANCGLDRSALTVCVKLLQAGVSPDLLANFVLELRKANRNENEAGTSSIRAKDDQKLNVRPGETPPIPAVRLRSQTDLGIVIKRWGIASQWRWKTEEEVCGICRLAFESPCPDCTMPGDDCRVDWGICNHCYHRHCINKWLTRSDSRGSCPLCRQEWTLQNS